MQYKSIIRLLKHCNIDYNAFDPVRAKKVLSAEFSITPGGIISIDGFDYTANDVFKELENPDFQRILKIHKLIWRNPELLNCLEKNEVTIHPNDFFIWIYYSSYGQDVNNFISPYFALSYSKIMGQLIKNAQFKEATRWLSMWLENKYSILNSDDRQTALNSTEIIIKDFIKLLRNINDTTYKNHLPELEKWFSQPWNLFINKLPDSLYDLKNNLLLAMLNFILIIKDTDKELAKKIHQQMVEVRNIDSGLYERI